MVVPQEERDSLTQAVIGAAIEVHREMAARNAAVMRAPWG